MAPPPFDGTIGFGSTLAPATSCTVTTNFTTRRGNIANVNDGPLSRDTSWGPAANKDPGGYEQCFVGATGTGLGNVGLWIQWDFGQYTSIGMLRFRAECEANFGHFKLQGSQTGDVWVDCGIHPVPIGGPHVAANDIYVPFMAIDDILGSPGIYSEGVDFYAAYSTLFWKKFRIIGVDEHVVFYPTDGGLPGQGVVPFDIWCMELCDPQYLDQVLQSPRIVAPWNDAIIGVEFGSNPGYDNSPPGSVPLPAKIPTGDIYSPLSHGNRSTMYDAIAWSDQVGNGTVLVTTGGPGAPDFEFAPARTGTNNNFGAATGDGPAYSGPPVGWYFQFDLAYAQALTAVLIYNDNNTNDFGIFKLQGLVGSDWVDLSTPQPVLANQVDTYGIGPYFAKITVDMTSVVSNQYRLTKVSGTGGGRFATEFVLEIAHSKLEGGDRRSGSDAIDITSTLALYDQTLGNAVDNSAPGPSLNYLIDGFAGTDNGGNSMGAPGGVAPSIRFVNGLQNAGRYLQFRFARAVTIRRAFISLDANHVEVYDSGGLPTRYGMWQWMASVDGTTFTNVGDPFAWGNRQETVILDGGTATSGVVAGYWRLVLANDTDIPFGSTMSEIRFQLDDVGSRTPLIMAADFHDDGGFATFLTTYTAPRPYNALYKDDGGFTATPTITYNAHIKANFVDEGSFDVYSELGFSMVTQMVLVQTGR